MARYTDAVCKKCRREGIKLFLKGTRCNSNKCSIDSDCHNDNISDNIDDNINESVNNDDSNSELISDSKGDSDNEIIDGDIDDTVEDDTAEGKIIEDVLKVNVSNTLKNISKLDLSNTTVYFDAYNNFSNINAKIKNNLY